MNADDFAFGAPDGPNTEEAAELANVLPPTLEEAYAEGRKDEREDFRMLLQQTQCVRDGWHPFTALALQAELLAALDDASECRHCYGKGWNDERKAVDGHYQGAEVFRIECEHCGGSGHAG